HGEQQVIVDDGQAAGEVADDVLELHGVGARCRPFEADHVGDLAQTLDGLEGDRGAGPERVVDDDADVGGARGGGDIFEEVFLGVGEVEWAGNLYELGAQFGGGLGEPLQLDRARGLRAHGDRQLAG